MTEETFQVDFTKKQVLPLSMKIFKEVTKKNGTAQNTM